jgi:hypothetical protein
MDEIELRDIPGFPGYLATSNGEIMSLRRLTPKILKKEKNANGYYRVSLQRGYDGSKRGGRTMKVMVHQLVARAFLGDPPNDGRHYVVRHLNDCGVDNRPCNLAWGTDYHNHMDRVRNGGFKLNKAKVLRIRHMIMEGVPYKEIAEYFQVSAETVKKIAKGKTWPFAGMTPSFRKWMREHDVRRNARLDFDMVIRIRDLLMQGLTPTQIANEFGVNRQLIVDVARGGWKRVPMSPEFADWSERYRKRKLAF